MQGLGSLAFHIMHTIENLHAPLELVHLHLLKHDISQPRTLKLTHSYHPAHYKRGGGAQTYALVELHTNRGGRMNFRGERTIYECVNHLNLMQARIKH